MNEVADRSLVRGGPPDEELVARIRHGEHALFEILMRRHNQRVYRALRSVLRDEAEIEDAMQQAYLQAWSELDGFQGNARFSGPARSNTVQNAAPEVKRPASA